MVCVTLHYLTMFMLQAEVALEIWGGPAESIKGPQYTLHLRQNGHINYEYNQILKSRINTKANV